MTDLEKMQPRPFKRNFFCRRGPKSLFSTKSCDCSPRRLHDKTHQALSRLDGASLVPHSRAGGACYGWGLDPAMQLLLPVTNARLVTCRSPQTRRSAEGCGKPS